MFVLLLVAGVAAAQTEPSVTDRQYLSGTGPADAVQWEFRVSGGRRAGEWSTIPVPQQWEQAGFGSYAYGFDEATSAEVGEYRHQFPVSADWSDRRVDLVFEGAMTDSRVRLNGEVLAPLHRGGFTRFAFDVAEILRFGGANLLEVEVAERSSNDSVNAAEREADYWVFGGIYRPVYLEARPQASVLELAVDARHDGTIRSELVVSSSGDRCGGHGPGAYARR